MSAFLKVNIEYKSDDYSTREAYIKVPRKAVTDREVLDRRMNNFFSSPIASYWVPKAGRLVEVMCCPDDFTAVEPFPEPFYEVA